MKIEAVLILVEGYPPMRAQVDTDRPWLTVQPMTHAPPLSDADAGAAASIPSTKIDLVRHIFNGRVAGRDRSVCAYATKTINKEALKTAAAWYFAGGGLARAKEYFIV